MAIISYIERQDWAANPETSKGRLIAEPASKMRNDFRRDCDRIIHSTSFRRLKHKTQVFLWGEGDHYRTRLTHSLEVQQIARSIARILGADEDLSEGLALAHDIGHPPFGHSGERALNRCLEKFGGFDHNAQALRVITRLEQHYPAFDGLNLTYELREGIVKHNGPFPKGKSIPKIINDHNQQQNLDLHLWPTIEAQLAALSDDIAYNTHDIDDGLRAKFFTIEDICTISYLAEIIDEVRHEHPQINIIYLRHELLRRMITKFVEDIVATTNRNINEQGITSLNHVRNASIPIVNFSTRVCDGIARIRDFLHPHMYQHKEVISVMRKAEQIVADLFAFYLENPQHLPPRWQALHKKYNDEPIEITIADYIAGMTDKYAQECHQHFIKNRQ